MNKIRLVELFFFLVLALAVLLRFPFIHALPFDSDQAIVGLMAKHMAQGEFPLLYYGDSYGGILEPALASIIFHLFGTSRFTLQLVPFLFSILFIVSIFQLGRELFNRTVGLMSMLIAAIPLYYWGLYSALANGGYIEIMWLGNLLLLNSHRFVVQKIFSLYPCSRYFFFGFFSGLAWWTHPLSIVYLITSCLFLCLKEKNFIIKGRVLFTALGFTCGSLPFWIWNVKYTFPFFRFIQSAEPVPYGSKLSATYHNILQFYGFSLKGEWASTIYIFVILILISLLLLVFGGRKLAARFPGSQGPLLLLIYGLVFFVVYSWSRFSENQVLRYLLPVYSLFPISLALLVFFLRSVNRLASLSLMMAILIFQVHGYQVSIELYQRMSLKNQKESQVERVLFQFLKEKNINFSYAPEYWIAPRLTFDSREEQIVVQPFNDRYPLYTFLTDASSKPAFILDGKYPKAFEEMFQAMGGTYKKKVIALYPGIKGYVVYYDFDPPKNQSTEILPGKWRGNSNVNPSATGLAFDRNISTGWSSAGPQQAGMFYQIDLGTCDKINRIVLISEKGKEQGFPRNYHLELSKNGQDWIEVSSIKNNWAYLFWSGGRPFWKLRDGRLENTFNPQDARFLKITLTGPAPNPWSIGELFVYQAAEQDKADPSPLKEIIAFLSRERIEYVYADVGLSAQITLSTQGKIKCLQDSYDITTRTDYAKWGYYDAFPYINKMKKQVDFSLSPAFVVAKENEPSFVRTMNTIPVTYSVKAFGDRVIYYGIKRASSSKMIKGEEDFGSFYWNGTHLLRLRKIR